MSRCKKEEFFLHSFIVASFNAQSVKGNDMAGKHCEISTFIKDNGVDLFFVTETWLSAQGDETKTVELAPSPLYQLWTIGVVVRMSILDTKVAGSNLSINMFSPWARDFIRIASVDSALKWVPGGDSLVKGVQCYELLGGIALKNHTFSFFFHVDLMWNHSHVNRDLVAVELLQYTNLL